VYFGSVVLRLSVGIERQAKVGEGVWLQLRVGWGGLYVNAIPGPWKWRAVGVADPGPTQGWPTMPMD